MGTSTPPIPPATGSTAAPGTTPTTTTPAPPPPLTPQQQAEAAFQKLTKPEKAMILREAVSAYVRLEYRDPVVRMVCQEYMTEVDDQARSALKEDAQSKHPKATTK